MRKIAVLLLLAMPFAACNKNNETSTDPLLPLEGLYSNEITSNICDEYVQVVSFDDERLFDVDLYANKAEDILVNFCPFSIRYSEYCDEGVIVPRGHDYIDSIYFFVDEVEDKLVALLYRDGKGTPDDSLQFFTKNNWLEGFIVGQVAAPKSYVPYHFCNGPADMSEVDTTEDIPLDADFNLSGDNNTKAIAVSVAAQWLGSTFLSSTFSYGLISVYDRIFKNDDATVENEKKLNDILAQTKEINAKLSDIDKRIKEIDSKLDRKAVTDKIERRNAMYASIHEVNYRYYNKLKDLRNDSALAADTTKLKEAIVPIIQEWGNTTVDGSPAYSSLKKIINMVMDNVSGINLFQVYDIFVFNTHNWENEGYVDREAFRISDLGIVAECCFLTELFYSVNNEKAMLEENDKNLQKFIDYFDKNPVVKNENVCVCQIKNAHMYLEKKARRINYDKPSWINGKEIAVGNNYNSMSVSESALLFDNQPQKFLKPEEARAIVNAYGNNESLASIFVKHGCCDSVNVSKFYIPLSSGHSFEFPNPGHPYDEIWREFTPDWMDVCINTMNASNNASYYTRPKLGRIKLTGEIGWKTKRFLLFRERKVFDVWHLKFTGWDTQETTQDWWNYDVIKRY